MLAYCASTMLAEMDELFLHLLQSRMKSSGQWTRSRVTNAEARDSGNNLVSYMGYNQSEACWLLEENS